MYHKAPARYRRQPLMTVSRPWTLALTLLLFITLALLGTRLPRLAKAKTARPRPASKALVEFPAQALKSLKGIAAAIPHKRLTTLLTVIAAIQQSPLAGYNLTRQQHDDSAEPRTALFLRLLPSRAPPSAT